MSLEIPLESTATTDQLGSADTASVSAWEQLSSGSIPCAPRLMPAIWVRLLNPPTAFSFDEAWLLCQYSENQWLAWVPDYGELLLSTDEFCSLTED